MNCKKCGEPIAAGEKFCSNCGEPAPVEPVVNQSTNYGYNNGAVNQGSYSNNNYGAYNNNYNYNNGQSYNSNQSYSNYDYPSSNPDGMFSDVGKKIETYAKVCMYICIGIACLTVFASFTVRGSAASYAILVAIISAGIIVVAGYVTSLMVFGFGKLIENVDEIKKMLEEKEKK